MEKVNIPQKLSLIHDHWNPRIAGELNGQHIKLVKFKGEFIWHKHDDDDEMFYVLQGEFKMELRDQTILLQENEFLIVPRGVEHRPVAENEVSVMLFEPASTLNTGDTRGDMTRDYLQKILKKVSSNR
ncbi:MAG: cupin domain-containing protein [Saprospiraceae bacterium]|uniref:Cupin domain-containing protein n=1 Tax=Candidatus Opimibacter skivensis TaxID=2982028 RepID=A0A9D7SVN9_9BACT|nr:cupin domain-containing protein [Candidatus Opimibacter skivensis]